MNEFVTTSESRTVTAHGIFNNICNDCDSSFFQDYENENNLQERPTDKMLAEIAVKNFLLQLSKRAQEKALYKNMQEKTGFLTNPEDLFEIKELDVRDYTEELFFHKDIADTEKQGGYQILFWKVLLSFVSCSCFASRKRSFCISSVSCFSVNRLSISAIFCLTSAVFFAI